MNNEGKKSNIRRQIEEAEYRHIENTHYFDMMEDIAARTIARSRMALDNNNLTSAEIEKLSEFESYGYRCASEIDAKREQTDREYYTQIEQYREELEKTDEEEKEGNNNSERE